MMSLFECSELPVTRTGVPIISDSMPCLLSSFSLILNKFLTSWNTDRKYCLRCVARKSRNLLKTGYYKLILSKVSADSLYVWMN